MKDLYLIVRIINANLKGMQFTSKLRISSVKIIIFLSEQTRKYCINLHIIGRMILISDLLGKYIERQSYIHILVHTHTHVIYL